MPVYTPGDKENRPVCRKCLLAELGEDEYFATLREYIANYPEEKSVPQEEYARRLSICRECDRLANGMCAVCGCYVELRALKNGQHCPEGAKW